MQTLEDELQVEIPQDSGEATELLEALGLIKCEWVREDQNEIL